MADWQLYFLLVCFDKWVDAFFFNPVDAIIHHFLIYGICKAPLRTKINNLRVHLPFDTSSFIVNFSFLSVLVPWKDLIHESTRGQG